MPQCPATTPAAVMTSLNSSVGSTSSGGGCSRGAGSGVGSMRFSWIARPTPLPSPPRPLTPPPPDAAAGPLQSRSNVSTRESRKRGPEAEVGNRGRAVVVVAEEEELDPVKGRRGDLVAGFGPFKVRTKRPRLLLGTTHKQLQEDPRWGFEGPHHGVGAAAAGVPGKGNYRASLDGGCFPIFQMIAGFGATRQEEAAAAEKEQLQVEQEGRRASGLSGRALLCAAANGEEPRQQGGRLLRASTGVRIPGNQCNRSSTASTGSINHCPLDHCPASSSSSSSSHPVVN